MAIDTNISGDSSTVEQPVFQLGDNGSNPISSLHSMRVKECDFSDIIRIFRKYHYKGAHMGGGISFCLGLYYQQSPVGGAVIGKLRHDKAYSEGVKNILEIRRMACLDECPKNSESYFLSKIIWFLKKHTATDEVISYSDLSVGHTGTIYKAANFELIGETEPTTHVFWRGVRYHPRSLSVERPYSHRLRAAVKTGEALVQTDKPKLIFKYVIKRNGRATLAPAPNTAVQEAMI